MRIIFFGTPDFAVASLAALLRAECQVVAVVTATDKWGGRDKKQLLESAVKKYAVAQGVPVLQPERLKDPAFLETLRSYAADLQIIVAFRMLPEVVWAMPRLGTFNLHGSLLPKYRGAAPINWAIIQGEAETGVTTFFLQHEIDTGDLIAQRRLPIEPTDTAGTLHDKMMLLGAELVVETANAIAAGNYATHPQDSALACPAPKLVAANTQINFQQSATAVFDFVRGLSPYPTAWSRWQGGQVKIFAVMPIVATHQAAVGTVRSDNKSYLHVATTDGWVAITDLQVENKRRMDIKSFLNGNKLPAESQFETA